MIKFTDIGTNVPKCNTATTECDSIQVLNFSNKTIQRDIPALPKNTNILFLSENEWSTPDLLHHLLTLTGKAKVCIATYSITENAVKQFTSILHTGLITACRFLMDRRVLKVAPAAYQLLKETGVQIEFRKCHAKIMLIQNEQFNVCVVSSANFHRNPRWEAGVITTDIDSFTFFQTQFDAIWK